jgi:hypothetical protein
MKREKRRLHGKRKKAAGPPPVLHPDEGRRVRQRKAVWNASAQKILGGLATLANAKVYLAWCNPDEPRVGLFANQTWEDKQRMLIYCSVYRDVESYPKYGVGSKTHSRRSGTPGMMLDGAPLSQLVDAGSPEYAKEQALLPAEQRAHLTAKSWVPNWQKFLLTNTGIGYMANTGPKCDQNVRLTATVLNKWSSAQVMRATKVIVPHTEIISPYCTEEARQRDWNRA